MTEYSFELKIPKERLAVLIGTGGKIKHDIEKATGTIIKIDSHEGDIFLYGEDGLGIYTAAEVIKAVGRGFNPDIAKLLLESDNAAEHIDLTDYAKSKKHMIRLKGRVIGEEGKARRIIEELTECHISVYGKTACIIGNAEMVGVARRAVENLLTGSPHANVFNWLEKKRRELKHKRMMTEL
jgi:ribosomal RNA assembly protein